MSAQNRLALRTALACAMGVAALGASHPARAANIVADSGFENETGGDNYASAPYKALLPFFNSAGTSIGPWNVTAGFVYLDGFAVQAHSGNNSVDLAPGNPLFPATLSQTLATTPGALYDLSFFVAARGVNTFAVSFGGVPVAGAPSSIPTTITTLGATDFSGDYVQYSFQVAATAATSLLAFTATDTDSPGNGPDVVQIDDISVTPAAAAVPEPASLALLAAGLAVVGGARRRRA